MALYPDAHVRLKNKNAETTDYDEIRQIRVPSASGGVEIFTHMESLRCYFVKPTGVDNYYEVVSIGISGVGTPSYVQFMANSIMLEDEEIFYELSSGEKRVMQILTTKTLTVGQTYHTSDF